jgi:hypothetical protein
MDKAIKKILKNFVFEDGELPHIEIEKHQTIFEGGKLQYVVSAHMPRKNKAFHSQEIARDIMEKMENALMMLGFSKVHGQMIRKENVLKIQALGHHD